MENNHKKILSDLLKKRQTHRKNLMWAYLYIARSAQKSYQEGEFKKEIFLIYRIKKEGTTESPKRELMEFYFPKSMFFWTKPEIKGSLNKVTATLNGLLEVNTEFLGEKLYPNLKERIGFEQQSIKYFLEKYKELEENPEMVDKIADYAARAVDLFYYLYDTEIVIDAYIIKYQKIGVVISEHGGFGDMTFSLKLYHIFTTELNKEVEIFCEKELGGGVIDKIKKIAPELLNKIKFAEWGMDLKNQTQGVSVFVAFMYKGERLKDFALKNNIPFIDLHEYDFMKGSRLELFGISSGVVGLLRTPAKPLSRQETLKNLIGSSSPHFKKIFESKWTLYYPSTLKTGSQPALFFDSLRAHQKESKEDVTLFLVSGDSPDRVKTILKYKTNYWSSKDEIIEKNERYTLLSIHTEESFTTYLINFQYVQTELLLSLITNSDFPVAITGDQSLSEAIQFQIPFFYVVASWKKKLYEELESLIMTLGCEIDQKKTMIILEALRYFTRGSFDYTEGCYKISMMFKKETFVVYKEILKKMNDIFHADFYLIDQINKAVEEAQK